MNHSPSPPDEPSLFDLPLQAESEGEAAPEPPEAVEEEPTPRPARRAARRPAARETLPLFQGGAEPEAGDGATIPFPLDALRPAPPPEPDEWPRLAHGARTARAVEVQPADDPAVESGAGAGLGARFRAAVADLVVFAAVAALMLVGTLRLGVELRWADWPAYAAFLIAFSFLYSVISLAFWGQTPGMVWAGIVARGEEAESLAFGQTARRWAGGLLTLALGGLPGLLALRGRSLVDRISGSRTLPLGPVAG